MKIVAIQEHATGPLGQLAADGSLAATAYTAKDDDHDASAWVWPRSAEVRSRRISIDGIERLARSHE